jgi:L-serine deaminase
VTAADAPTGGISIVYLISAPTERAPEAMQTISAKMPDMLDIMTDIYYTPSGMKLSGAMEVAIR